MAMPHDDPTLDDVTENYEEALADRREHAKASPRPDDEELERRTDIERREVGLDEDG